MEGLPMRKFKVRLSSASSAAVEVSADRFELSGGPASSAAHFYTAGRLTDYFRDPYAVTEIDTPKDRVHVGVHEWMSIRPQKKVVAKLTIDGGDYADAKRSDMIRLLNDFCKKQSYGLDIMSIEVEVVS